MTATRALSLHEYHSMNLLVRSGLKVGFLSSSKRAFILGAALRCGEDPRRGGEGRREDLVWFVLLSLKRVHLQ